MEKVLNEIKCPTCHCFLESPVLLPCQHSICQQHVLAGLSNRVKCGGCNREHEIPNEGFLQNQPLANIIASKIHLLEFWKIHDEAKIYCSNLKTVIDQVAVFLNDPEYYTHEEVDRLKNAVLIKREELKIKIDKEAERLLAKLDQHAVNCRNYLNDAGYKSQLEKLTILNSEAQSKLNAWQKELDGLTQDETSWIRISNEIVNEKKILGLNLELLQQILLLKEFKEMRFHTGFFTKINIDFSFTFVFIDLDSKIVNTNEMKKDLARLCAFNAYQEWNLLYRGSEHGFGSDDFHYRCDSTRNTLTIIKSSSGYIFGGFTSVEWNDTKNENEKLQTCQRVSKKYKSDQNAYVFSLRNPKRKKPLKVKVSDTARAIYCDKSCGPSFGDEDIRIFQDANTYENDSVPSVYKIDRKQNENNSSDENDYYPYCSGESYLTGAQTFKVAEIEVFFLV